MGGYALGVQQAEHDYDHRQARNEHLSDAELEQNINDVNGRIAGYRQIFSDPNSTPDERAQAQTGLESARGEMVDLFHPAKNPNALQKFGHLLTQHFKSVGEPPAAQAPPFNLPGNNPMGGGGVALPAGPMTKITTPSPAELRNKAWAQQQIASTPVNDPLREMGREGAFNRQQTLAGREADVAYAKAHGFDEGQTDELIQHQLGIPTAKLPKALAGDAGKPFKGTDGQYYYKAQDPSTGAIMNIALGPDWTPPAPKQSTSAEAFDRAAFAKSLNKKPEDLTPAELGRFERQRWMDHNPLGPARFGLSREALNYRESTGDLSNYLKVIKQEQPLERLQLVSQESQQDVANPTGPGDAALTLAFFDAIKTNGVRFTKQEQDLINNSRGVLEGWQAKFESGYNGTAFGPQGSEQRAIIAGIVQKGAQAAAAQKQAITQGAGAFRPSLGKVLGSSSGAPPPAATGKGSRSVSAAMALPFNKGKTRQQVEDDLKKHGYNPVP